MFVVFVEYGHGMFDIRQERGMKSKKSLFLFAHTTKS